MRSQLVSFGSMQEEARQLLHHAMMAALIESAVWLCSCFLLSGCSTGLARHALRSIEACKSPFNLQIVRPLAGIKSY